MVPISPDRSPGAARLDHDAPAHDTPEQDIGRPGRQAGSGTPGRGRTRRRRLRRALIITHRWVALLLGVLLITQTAAGSFLLYAPEYFHATHQPLFHRTPAARDVSMGQALAVVQAAAPEFHPGVVKVDNGIYEVGSADKLNPYVYGVDPGTGRITGKANLNGGLPGFVFNLHTCGLTCPEYPGYTPFLTKHPPTRGLAWLRELTLANIWLGTVASMLLFLALSGIVLWSSSLRRLAHALRVRWRKSRYARGLDLHRLIGLLAIPMLLVWSITGASFEFPVVNSAWFALTGGRPGVAHPAHFASRPAGPGSADITVDAAVEAAHHIAPGQVTSVQTPAGQKPAGFYTIKVAAGHDPWRHSLRPGQVTVGVDRHDASRAAILVAAQGPTLSNTVWDRWRAPVFHYGYAVNGWWRLFWLAFGLTPSALAITGLATFLRRRQHQRQRRRTSQVGPSWPNTASN